MTAEMSTNRHAVFDDVLDFDGSLLVEEENSKIVVENLSNSKIYDIIGVQKPVFCDMDKEGADSMVKNIQDKNQLNYSLVVLLLREKDQVILSLRNEIKLLNDKISLLNEIRGLSQSMNNISTADNKDVLDDDKDAEKPAEKIKKSDDGESVSGGGLLDSALDSAELVDKSENAARSVGPEPNKDDFQLYQSRKQKRRNRDPSGTLKAGQSEALEADIVPDIGLVSRGKTLSSELSVSVGNVTKNRKLFFGSNKGVTALKAASAYNKKWFFVSRLDSHVTREDILRFLTAQQSAEFEVQELKTRHEDSHYRSFKIGVPAAVADEVMSPGIWPYGVLINTFYFKRRTAGVAAQNFQGETRKMNKI